MSRITVILITAILLLTLASSLAFAGGAGQAPAFYFTVQGLPGWSYFTASSAIAQITPPFYANSEGNVPYNAPLHDNNFTNVYWVTDEGQKLSTQCLSTPNPVGDLLFIGFVKVGANDTRTKQTFNWYVDNSQSDLTWFAIMHSVDTRRRVFVELIEPGSTNNSGSFTTKTSQGGYDLLVAAYTNPVPEPSSILAVFTGFIGLVGYGLRRRRQ
jgi:hypothetical protein